MVPKTLHTVTSAVNVARYLLRGSGAHDHNAPRLQNVERAMQAVEDALSLLGQPSTVNDLSVGSDVTLFRAVVAIYSDLSGEGDTVAKNDVRAICASVGAGR